MIAERRAPHRRFLSRGRQIEFRIFALLAPLLYLAYAVITPPFQTPDEQQHLFRAWQLAQGELIGTRDGDRAGGMLPVALSVAAAKEIGTAEPHLHGPRPRATYDVARHARTTVEAGQRQFTDFLGSVLYPPTSYLPQTIAVMLGRATDLSVENVVRLGRLLNAAVALVLMGCAILLTPFGKRVLLFIGVMPMTAACAASLGQDGLIIGGCCLSIALALRRWAKLRPFRGERLTSIGLALVTLLGKPVYLPLMLLGIRPRSSDIADGRRNADILIGVALSLIVLAGWRALVSTLEVPAVVGVPATGVRLTEWMHHPTVLLTMMRDTVEYRGLTLVGTLAMFGWMDVGPVGGVFWTVLLSPLFLLVTGDGGGIEPGRTLRIWLVMGAVACSLMIVLVAFLLWTPADSLFISGLQGRYFIPPVAALLLAILPRKALIPSGWPIAPALMLVANVAALNAIAQTYYG